MHAGVKHAVLQEDARVKKVAKAVVIIAILVEKVHKYSRNTKDSWRICGSHE